MSEETPEYGRVSWDQYFLDLARHVAARSTCLRRQVGAVAVKDKRILATGYNGAPSGLRHCEDLGCMREKMNVPPGERHELCRAVHAEQNVICQAARFGISLEDAGLYISGGTPCLMCAKLIINADISWIVSDSAYPDELALEMLREAGVFVEVMG
jgi:dCMP deaminase